MKPWYQSKVVWAGILQTLSAVLLSAADLVNKSAISTICPDTRDGRY